MAEPEWLTELKKESVGNKWDDDIYADLDLSLSTLKPGLVLWNGSQSRSEKTTMTKRELWWGRGQMSLYSPRPENDPEFVVKYFSTEKKGPEGYAHCSFRDHHLQGWIHKFKVIRPIPILKIGAGIFLEWDGLVRLCKFVFKHGIKGICIQWGSDISEVALCNWVPELKYVVSHGCLPHKKCTPLYDALIVSKSGGHPRQMAADTAAGVDDSPIWAWRQARLDSVRGVDYTTTESGCNCKPDGEKGVSLYHSNEIGALEGIGVEWWEIDDPQGYCVKGSRNRCVDWDDEEGCIGYYWDYKKPVQHRSSHFWVPPSPEDDLAEGGCVECARQDRVRARFIKRRAQSRV